MLPKKLHTYFGEVKRNPNRVAQRWSAGRNVKRFLKVQVTVDRTSKGDYLGTACLVGPGTKGAWRGWKKNLDRRGGMARNSCGQGLGKTPTKAFNQALRKLAGKTK